jgi:hypothetical protein
MTITLKALISYIKIDRAIKYIIINAFGDDFPCSHKNQQYVVTWTRNLNFQHNLNILEVCKYM